MKYTANTAAYEATSNQLASWLISKQTLMIMPDTKGRKNLKNGTWANIDFIIDFKNRVYMLIQMIMLKISKYNLYTTLKYTLAKIRNYD